MRGRGGWVGENEELRTWTRTRTRSRARQEAEISMGPARWYILKPIPELGGKD